MYTITEGRVAAVVSGLAGSKIRPQRANLAAHQAVLKCLMADTTPLPMAFGTIAASPEAIRRILVRNQRAFQEQLQRVAGKVEMGLARSLGRTEYLRVFRQHACGTAPGAGPPGGRPPRVHAGREDRTGPDVRPPAQSTTGRTTPGRCEHALAPVCVEFKANPCRNEHEVMNVACLVRRDAQEEFSAGVFAAAKLFDNNFAFDYSGPWAPHNFVELELDLEQ